MLQIDEILARHQITAPCHPLLATGIANHIYATDDLVIRIATDHEDAFPDACTESVAAPAAFAAGLKTPRLIASNLHPHPYSIWQRIHGETLGLIQLDHAQSQHLWRQVGQQLALLHDRVKTCPDPNRYLDTPAHEPDLAEDLEQWIEATQPTPDEVADLKQRIHQLKPHLANQPAPCFLHNDLHSNNIMCTPTGELLAILDWGDAGWGDPTLDFAAIPFPYLAAALEGYGDPTRLGPDPRPRILWAQIQHAFDEDQYPIPIHDYRRFLNSQ